ncbi:RNA-guided endonuclease InsQ/TnpB family protein [Streptosporangium sp. NPDC001559]|uniref:RNA-guided endonuclease InsQ/TnpB family protein n=1 Tax=Streptosporangium sp. NPDC001559 TaxID=3366187 RepID=UPI0036E4B533
MLVTEMLKLSPAAEQCEALLATMRACNAAATRAAEVAFAHHTANKIAVQKLIYAGLRAEFALPAQMAIRSIAKACEAYKRDKNIRPVFRELGAVAYDQRILTFKGRDLISIATLNGRILVPVVYQGRWLGVSGTTMRGQADLIWRDGAFYLAVVIEVPEPPGGGEPDGWLGVDLGIVNLAADSTGTTHSGKAVRALRHRNRMLRRRLQKKGTKSAKRLLKARRRKEARFARDTNHVISKALVGKAKDTRMGIALEDLGGIRDRVTVTKAQRADHHSWAFHQLRTFVTYKAALAGVPVRLVDPRNTSRTCPECGHCAKRNRPHRDSFLCVACGFAGPADHIAAINIGRRAVSHAADDAA